MAKVTHVVGVDPGLVHTGVVRLLWKDHHLIVEPHVVNGPEAEEVEDWIRSGSGLPMPQVFVEEYRPRQSLTVNTAMVMVEKDFRTHLHGARFLSNTGIKRVVPNTVLEVMGLWKFPATHHQDLQSAARIAVLGMLKDDNLNVLVSDLIKAHLSGHPWTIERL